MKKSNKRALLLKFSLLIVSIGVLFICFNFFPLKNHSLTALAKHGKTAFQNNQNGSSNICSITQITNTVNTNYNIRPSISGNGKFIAFSSAADLTGQNSDRNREIFLYDVAANTFTQITNTNNFQTSYDPLISNDGSRIAFISDADLTGDIPNPNGRPNVFHYNGTFTQVTNPVPYSSGGRSESLSISGDGMSIVFESMGDLTGNNPNKYLELFLYKGGIVTQITTSDLRDDGKSPSINYNGSKIAFSSLSNLTGENPNRSTQLFIYNGVITQITPYLGERTVSTLASINNSGRRIAFASTSNLTGENPEKNFELFLYDAERNDPFNQITKTTTGNTLSPSINSDSVTSIAFVSSSDLTGQNPDGNSEIFLYDNRTITQITNTTGMNNSGPSISIDGKLIAFSSTADIAGENPDGNWEIFLANCRETESVDTDGDSISDDVDTDDDNDGQTDDDEIACGSNPLNPDSISPDNDGDNIPDCVDPDDDNDGIADEQDAFPFDPNESIDADGDGIGNNADPDDDNDGQLDVDETACGSDPLDAASKSPDADNDDIPDCVDSDDDNDGIPDVCDMNSNPGAEDFDRDGIVDSSSCDTQIGPPVDKDQCKNNGWRRFNNPSFPNKGQCVSYVNRN